MDPLSQVQAGTADVNSPAPVDVTGLPTSTPADQNAAVPAVDPSQLQEQPLNNGQPMGGPPAAQAQPPKPSMWKNVLRGALAGLELGGGVGAAIGAVDPKMAIQAKQNRETVSNARAQFASLQAADQMLTNSVHKWNLEHLPEEMQLERAKAYAPVIESLIKEGVFPMAASKLGDGKSDVSALNSMGQSNPKGIPGTVGMPLPDGTYVYFSLDGMARSQQVLKDVNLMRKMTGNQEYTPDVWNNKNLNPPSARNQAIKDATHYFHPADLVKSEADVDAKIPEWRAKLQQAKLLRQNGDPDGAELVTKTEAALQELQDQKAQFEKTNQEKLGRQKELANTAANSRGQSLLHSRVVKTVDNNGQEVYTTGDQAVGKVTDTSYNSLDKDYLKPAQDVEKSYQMFQSAYNDFRKGTKTGAQSMLALSQHLQTTFGTVKGGRVTKDMIAEHLHARSVSDDARVAVQRLINGDVLSPDQWDAFRGLITQSRNLQWGIVKQEASQRGINVQKLLPSDLGGQGNINFTPQTHVFSVSAWAKANPGKDARAAQALAQKKGFKVVP